jgi:hypothetical protein
MKRILLASVLLLSGIFSASAQDVGKGCFYIGGSFNYNYDQAGTSTTYTYPTGTTLYTNEHVTNIQLSPDFGFFLSKNWAVGIQLGYNRVSGTEINAYTADDNTTTSYTTVHNYHTDAFGLGAHVRYYWMLSDRVGIFPQFGFTTSNDVNNFNDGTLAIGGNPNIVFFATPRLAINLGFGNIEYDLNYLSKTSSFNVGLNTNIGFGLNYYWGK